MTLAKWSEFPSQPEVPTREYRGFTIEQDPRDQHLFSVTNKQTGERLPGRFLSKRAIEAEINSYHAIEEHKTKLAELIDDRPAS